MSDDPPPTPRPLSVSVDGKFSLATSSEDDWGLPDKIEKMSRKELRRRIRNLIELLRRTGRGEADPKGGMQLVIIAVQYLTDELARRNQSCQTWWIIAMTAVITIITLVMTVEAICPQWLQSTVHSLLIRAS